MVRVMSTEAVAYPADNDRRFLGHPLGLGFLSFSEAWERFSFYGMQSLLVLYMTQQLLLPGHVEKVWGFAGFKAFLQQIHIFGDVSTTVALGSAVFGAYAALVYLTPLLGGFIADRVLGRTPTIAIGAIAMAAGYFMLAAEAPFLIALALLLIGVGMFKGNIASQVGELYGPADLRRADAFQIYFLGINIAVIIAPLVCGTLGQKVAWEWGFAAAGVSMILGLAVYLAGRRLLPRDTVKRAGEVKAEAPRLAPGEGRTILVLIALIPILAMSAIGNQQIFNAYVLWGNDHYQLRFGGQELPVTWLISFDALISTGALIASLSFWRWWGTKRREPDEIVKLVIGAIIAAFAPLMLAAASMQEAATGQKVGLIWALGFHLVNDFGFSNLFPVGLALFSRASPRAVAGMMIGVYYLNLFLANYAIGYLGGLLDKMPPTQFWLMHAAIIAVGAVLLLLFARIFHRDLAPTVDPEAVSTN